MTAVTKIVIKPVTADTSLMTRLTAMIASEAEERLIWEVVIRVSLESTFLKALRRKSLEQY
jgi:hypothetical protein